MATVILAATAQADGIATSGASQAYGGYVGQLANEVAGLASSAEGEGSLAPLFLDFDAPQAADLDGLGAADRALVRAMSRTHDLFRALGGDSDRRGVVERRDGRVYVGLDGEGGRWFVSVAEAAAFLLSDLIETAPEVPDPVQETIASVSDGACGASVSCVAETAYRALVQLVAYVPRGTTVSLTLSAEGFSDAGGGPTVEAPQGFTVHDVSFVDGATITARVSVLPDAETGQAVLSAFNTGQAFAAVETFAVQVVDTVEQLDAPQGAPLLPGSGTLDEIVDDHAGEAAGATELETVADGRIEQAGDADVFSLDVAQPATVTLTTSGPSDVRLTVRDAEGTALASDDDSAAWYNAAISQPLAAGTYFVEVSHCCGGTGPYTLSATAE